MRRESGQFGWRGEPPVNEQTSFVVSDKNAAIPYDLLYPHNSDRRFAKGAQTIFLEPGFKTDIKYGIQLVEGAHYNYSDKLLRSFGLDKYEESSLQAEAIVGNINNARYFEELMRLLYKKPQAKLVHILVGVNVGNGYSYRVFGTINPSEQEPQISGK